MLIRLQRIYNLWSIHAIILSILDVLWALLCTFILLLGLTYWPRAQCQFLFFPLFQCFTEKEYQMESKRNETFGNVIFGRTWSRGLGPYVKKATRRARGRGARPPPSWAPRCSTDVLLPPIYTYVPPNYQLRTQKPNSSAATFCTREIPSWGLFRSSAGGGIDHRGLLHQHHSLSDDVWVVYHRPLGP